MKKTLSLVLMFCMLVSVVAPALVFAETEPVNLAAGKEVLNAKVNGQNANYCADMTDGVIADAISTENGVWFGYWYNGDADAETIEKYSNTDENGVAIPTIDLGGSYELSSARIHIVDQAGWGIAAPTSVVAQVSDDGETFEDVATVTEFESGVTWVDFDLGGVTAQYVRFAIDLSTSWFFLDEIEIYGVGAAGGDVEEPVEPEANITVNVGDVPVAFDEAKLDLLADGNTASDATAFSNAGLVGFENKGFTHTDGADAAVEATFEIILDLGEVQTIGSISLDAYKESSSMIALPTVNYYVSVDGVNYYQINAGGKVSPAADAAESKVHTLKADFSTRIAVEAQYVKAVVSFKNGWVFLSELSVGAGNETVASEAPDKAYPYSVHTVPNPGVGIFDAADGALELSTNDGATGHLFRNAQLIKAAFDAEIGAYVIEYSKVNPWPDGHSGVEKLADGEILVAISTGGVVTSDEFSGCKWIARGLTAGDLIVLNEDTIQFLPAGALVPEVPDEPEPVELPEGALLLDYAGYKHAGVNSIVAGDGMTVFELTALGNDGNAKDMNYAYIVVVDADNVVVQTWCELSVAKSDVVCPEGGYIISFNGNKDGYKDLAAIEEGAVITLYNVDVDAFRGAEGNYELTNAGFTYENPAVDEPVTPPVAVEKPENAEMFWVTHYENNTVEGSGVIFTKPYDGAVWWYHIAFAPAENGAYEIVEISNGLSDGSGTALAIPEGGFVWATNTGNDYPTLGMDGPDYTSPNCNDAIARALNWAIGDQFVVGGFDFVNVPTSTPDVDWYDDAYVCTAWIAPYVDEEEPVVPEPPVEPEDVVNLVAGLEYVISEQFHMSTVNWGYDPSYPASYPDEGFELTDGVWPTAEEGYGAAGWMAFNKQTPPQAERGYAYVRFDLGKLADLTGFKLVSFKDIATGITCPYKIEVLVSVDGDEYASAGLIDIDGEQLEALADKSVHELTCDLAGTAQYIEVRITSYGWAFLGEIEIYGCEAEGTDTPVDPEPENKTYENTMVEGEDGNYSCEVPYGFTWVIDDLNGTIGGEDNTICTTQDAYNACNPNWAITIYAEKQADGTYVALKDAIVTPGSAANAGITIGENQIAIVMHSAYSNPNGTNWESKVVAMAVKAGDVLVVDMDAMTVYAPIPGEDIVLPEPPVVEPEEKITTVVETIVNDDNTVTVNVSFAGIVSELTGASAKLYFDGAVLKLLNTIDEENSIDCLVKVPGEKWENLTSLSADGSYIAINVCTTEDVDAILADGNLVLSFTFAISAGYETTLVEVTDVEFLDTNIDYVYGNGSAVEIELPEQEIPEEPTNLVAGKDWTGDTNIGTSYVGNLTDGVIEPDGKYDTTLWYGADNRLDDNGAFTMIFDLGGKYSVSEVLAHVWPAGHSGIVIPASIDVYVSVDGENYELYGSVSEFDGNTPQWVRFAEGSVDATHVRVDMVGGEPGVFWFASEIEVYGVPATAEPEPPVDPEVPTGSESLIPGEGANWINTDHNGVSVDVIYNEDGSVTFTGSVSGTWPSVETWYIDTPIIADTLDDYLSIDFTVAGGTTNINFFFDDGNGGSVSFSISNTALNAACPGATIDAGSGDIYDGTYKCNISIADLIASVMNLYDQAFPEAAIIDGTLKFIGINVYSVNGATITINDLSVVHVSEEEPEPPVDPEDPETPAGTINVDGKLDENAYDNAVWFDKGVWQSVNEYQIADLDIAYTTLADAENIYLAIRVNKGVDFATALNPDAWDQSGATNFRLWFKGDGMESRTFFDLLWNGEEFAPFLIKQPTEQMTFAATYGDDYIALEVKIAKADLSITDSFEMMVTYSTPYCGEGENLAYNAFHMTSFVRGEDGALPSGWSGNTSMYESYNVEDITLAEVALGDVNGDGKISSLDVVKLLNYLANYNYADGTCDVEITEGADVTGDGIVDGRDSVRLLKYLANRDPATGESSVELG